MSGLSALINEALFTVQNSLSVYKRIYIFFFNYLTIITTVLLEA